MVWLFLVRREGVFLFPSPDTTYHFSFQYKGRRKDSPVRLHMSNWVLAVEEKGKGPKELGMAKAELCSIIVQI